MFTFLQALTEAEAITPDLILKTGVAFVSAVLLNFSRGIISDVMKKKKEKKKEKTTVEARESLIGKIDKSIELGEANSKGISELYEMHKNDTDIQTLSERIEFTNSFKSKILPAELKRTIKVGTVEANSIFTHILRNDFALEHEYIKARIKDSFETIADSFDSSAFEIKDYDKFKADLVGQIESLKDRYLIDLVEIFKQTNGVRRKAFSNKSYDLIIDIILATERIYKKHK